MGKINLRIVGLFVVGLAIFLFLYLILTGNLAAEICSVEGISLLLNIAIALFNNGEGKNK